MRTGFSIRTKLLLVAMLLLLIPWMSYIYVRDMKTFLLSGQQQALTLTSRAIATVLHDRPELFDAASDPSEGNEIYAAPLPNYININGDLSDWGEHVKQASSFSPSPVESLINSDNVIEVKHALGYRGNFIYAFFQVSDETVRYRPSGFLRVDTADHVRITLQNPDRVVRRYTLIASEAGRMSIYLMDEQWQYPTTGDPNYELAAEMALTEQGYNVEVRIPRSLISSETRISMTVADVDDSETLQQEALVHTTPLSDNDEPSKLSVQSPEIAKILQGLDREETRIWVFSRDKSVRNVVGNLITDEGDDEFDKPSGTTGLSYLWEMIRYYYNSSLQTIFSYIIERPNSDAGRSVEERNDEIIEKALNGEVSSDRRRSINNKSTILMSGHPVYLGDGILGAVVVEQSTNQLLRQQKETLENVISVTLLVLLTVATALLIFSSRLTLRIRRLRNATETAIDRDGRIISGLMRKQSQATKLAIFLVRSAIC